MFSMWIVWWLFPAFGIPLFVVGLILLLCERSLQKHVESMGSLPLLVVGFILCLPFLFALSEYAFFLSRARVDAQPLHRFGYRSPRATGIISSQAPAR